MQVQATRLEHKAKRDESLIYDVEEKERWMQSLDDVRAAGTISAKLHLINFNLVDDQLSM